MNSELRKQDVEILIVEDSPTQAEHLIYVLEGEGYRHRVARNGREALKCIAQRQPTLVVSDVVMPELDGYQLCQAIKRDETLRHIPVMLLTSLSDPADVVRGLESGADNFIFKPYDERYLLARIAYVLANRHLREADSAQMGVEIFFAGRKFFITSDRLQILNLLLSTYEAAVEKNRELMAAQEALRYLNEHLEAKVRERTADLSAQIAERIRAEQKQQQHLVRLELMNRITHAIAERQDLKRIFHVVLRNLEENLPVEFGCICMAASGVFTVAGLGPKSAALARAAGLAEHTKLDIGQNALSRCLAGQLLHEPDLSRLDLPLARQLTAAGLRAFVAAPLLVENEASGVLMVARSAPDSFSSGDCDFLRHLSEHVGLATRQAQLFNALEQAYDDLRRTQQAVMQQERLRALGQLASGVAHDINNSISPITLYAEALLEREKGLSPQGREYLVTIQRAIDNVAQTVARMRQFYRQRETDMIPTRLSANAVIQQVLELTRPRWYDIPHGQGIAIELRTELAPDLPAFMGSESELRDAITNLILNAVDAMPHGGALTVRTRAMDPAQGARESHVPRRVCIEVIDTGQGMDEETRRRCLEPFFTTKGERGTGMGLAMVYGMIQRHGAELEIETAPGRGTTMRLIFTEAVSAAESADTVVTWQLPSRPLRILVIDDDPMLVQSLRDTLQDDGHSVIAADGGQAGIDAFLAAAGRGESSDIVITDLGMPDVDGRKVAAAIKNASPSTPVILLTGWGQRMLQERESVPHVDRILSKPPKLHELRSVLAQFTAGSGGQAT